jgi:hypothetical protein
VTKLRQVILSYFCCGACIFGVATASIAAGPEKNRSIAGPFYNPETNSYFQIYEKNTSTWDKMNKFATRLRYKGQRGHLAIIKDPQILKFVQKNFSKFWRAGGGHEVWIGLRYFCKYSKLMWVDGKLQGPKVSGMWHPQWYRTPIRCSNRGYMPVYLIPRGRGSLFWQASGPNKGFSHYMVEYPAADKSKKISQNTTETPKPAETSPAE